MTARASSSSVHLTHPADRYLQSVEQLRPSSPDDLRWELTYDQATIEQFVAEVDEEVARLRAGIEVARERIAAARGGSAPGDDDATAVLSDLVFAAQSELAAIEQEHQKRVASIRAAAEAEAARLIAVGRAEAAAARTAAAEIAGVLRNHVGRISDVGSANEVDAPASPDGRNAG